MRNHQEIKRQALINAIKNTALGKSPEENIQMIFLNYIDSLTPWHFILLYYFQNPKKYGEEHEIKYPDWVSGGMSTVLEHTFPELRGKRELYDKLTYDLFTNGLIGTERLHTTVTGAGMFSGITTTLGNQFLKFISESGD
jgi:hypothetical protein